jgi:hypothetical protein
MFRSKTILSIGILAAFFTAACQQTDKPAATPGSLKGVAAQRLSYTFEPDTIPPVDDDVATEIRYASVQADFDQNRPEELLDQTILSPDKQRVLAVFHRAGDSSKAFRMDMYGADGKMIGHASPDAMAVSLPDSIVWSPDSNTVAFVAVARLQVPAAPGSPAPTPPEPDIAETPAANTDANTDANSNVNSDVNSANSNANTNVSAPVQPVQPLVTVKLFSNEQVYTVNKEGVDLKYISQKDTLIYFYMLWSPDSTMLATLACSPWEWYQGGMYAQVKGEEFMPFGRPRLIEKIGRERLLDDNLTVVHPAWSPDSSKVAYTFDKEVKLYDTVGEVPTYASIPLRVPLLTSSQQFDVKLKKQEADKGPEETNSNAKANSKGNANANSNAVPASTPNISQGIQVMPNESELVSFNPIVELKWLDERTIYLQTGYIKEMTDSRFSSRSYMRWHRLNLSAQAAAVAR